MFLSRMLYVHNEYAKDVLCQQHFLKEKKHCDLFCLNKRKMEEESEFVVTMVVIRRYFLCTAPVPPQACINFSNSLTKVPNFFLLLVARTINKVIRLTFLCVNTYICWFWITFIVISYFQSVMVWIFPWKQNFLQFSLKGYKAIMLLF